MISTYVMSTSELLAQGAFTHTSSGPWSVNAIPEAQTPRRTPRGYLRPIGVLLMIALSPLTSVPDPWVIERRRLTPTTAHVWTAVLARRRISLREAREMALHLMAEIEEARLWTADQEARRTFDLEDLA